MSTSLGSSLAPPASTLHLRSLTLLVRLLDLILNDVESWAKCDLWSRIQNRAVIADQTQLHHDELTDMHKKFKVRLLLR